MALALSLGALGAFMIRRMMGVEDEAAIERETEARLEALRGHLFRERHPWGRAAARVDAADGARR